MLPSTISSSKIESEIYRAFNNDEFELYYQPKINNRTHKICGAEALIRWNSPEYGLLLPGCFINILEKSGLINDVGFWTLQTVLQDMERLSKESHAKKRFSVNVSAVQLHKDYLKNSLKKLSENNLLYLPLLDIEITESQLIRDLEQCIDSLLDIRNMGVTVALDDFGAGYSSLSHLSDLPIDTLKIDRSLISSISNKKINRHIVEMVIKLAHSMDINVVAEGVETHDQLAVLKQLHCNEIQGWLFHKAMPFKNLSELLNLSDSQYLLSPLS